MILCCGEALIDMIPVADSDGKAAFSPLSGGAIFNTSIALGRLDTPVALLSGISTDLFGKQLNKELLNSNVSTEFLIRSDRPTTLAFVLLKNGNAEYTFYDENSAGRLIEVNDIPIILEIEISSSCHKTVTIIGIPILILLANVAKETPLN